MQPKAESADADEPAAKDVAARRGAMNAASSDHPNAELIRELYRCYAKGDLAGAMRLYHPDVVFSDPIFPKLRGVEELVSMWRMVAEGLRRESLEASEVEADDHEGRARWDVRYVFGETQRPVHNVVEARFQFQDGKIIRHVDSFDLHRWTSMAFGMRGRLFGWLGPMQNMVRRKAAQNLENYRQRSKAPPKPA